MRGKRSRALAAAVDGVRADHRRAKKAYTRAGGPELTLRPEHRLEKRKPRVAPTFRSGR